MPKKELYLAIKTAIKGKLPLAFIDLQKGQFLKEKENLPVPLPAALIEISSVNWVEFSTKAQKGQGKFEVEFYIPNVENTFDDSESETESLDFLALWDSIFLGVNGIKGDKFNYVERTGDRKVLYTEKYICMTIEFKVNLIQNYK